ncbi:PIG-L family deacetylase [Serinibacter arcticus]|uniref:N-acetyl-1-D-myo-inosityl-2-amino-2-deoxy-alpha-D-glucopyranoside deacetylase MshB n=1 Tax=Serinibacter arcticus TaxID=1655435 RepID=A0A4Z1DX51_9MICO|nr:PIG-L family deacetylase [Serinibacter arcticus]TGO04124.1 N-acetyl-1-D-myo-inosityl-2-amino-2-deoxy-alpha-D-glucopyranoside deacetylase MshB [Serinibacter arcticus]
MASVDGGGPAEELLLGPVLAVFAHPDDETLLAGGLLALAASRGRRVVVVTATRGERGEMIGRPDLEGTDAVPRVREQEVAAALEALGVREHHWLGDLVDGAGYGWTDSGMTWVAPGIAGPAPDAPGTALTSGDLEVQAAALARLIRDVRPAVVVGDEAGGSYGHPDHSRAHTILARALVLAARGEDGRADGARPVHAALAVAQDRQRAANEAVAVRLSVEETLTVTGLPLLPPPGAGTPLPTLARPLADVDVELDTTGVAPQVLAALRSYPSQVQGVTVPALDGVRTGARGGAATRALAALATDQAAIGWYAMSNGVAQPLLPVVGLTAVRGDVADLRAALGDLPRAGEAAGPADVRPLVTPPSRGRIAAVLGCLVLGLVVGLTATVVHRWRVVDLPLGLVLAFVTVVVGGLTARSWGRGAGLLGFAVGAVGMIQAMAFVVAGGDVLVPGDTLGMVWLLGSVVAVGVAAFLPERWVGRTRTR